MKELVSKLLSRLHLVLFLYAAWTTYDVYSNHEALLAEITAQKEPLEADIKKSEEKLSQIDEFRKNVDLTKLKVTEVFNSIEKVQRQLPSEVNDIEVLDFLSKEGRALNMPEIEPNPLEEVPMGFYISKPYKVRARGTFLQFVIFLERINAAERLFNVREFTITAPEEVQRGRFQVVTLNATIDTFKYNSSHKESSGVDDIAEKFEGNKEEKPRRRKRKKEDA